MLSSHTRDLRPQAYSAYTAIFNTLSDDASRNRYIESILQDESGVVVLELLKGLISANIVVKRQAVWLAQSELYGKYPANQQDVDTIKYIDGKIEKLNHNPDIKFHENMLKVISDRLLEAKQQLQRSASLSESSSSFYKRN